MMFHLLFCGFFLILERLRGNWLAHLPSCFVRLLQCKLSGADVMLNV
jgi:hypothetical protein